VRHPDAPSVVVRIEDQAEIATIITACVDFSIATTSY
jgi:hypothetical protein